MDVEILGDEMDIDGELDADINQDEMSLGAKKEWNKLSNVYMIAKILSRYMFKYICHEDLKKLEKSCEFFSMLIRNYKMDNLYFDSRCCMKNVKNLSITIDKYLRHDPSFYRDVKAIFLSSPNLLEFFDIFDTPSLTHIQFSFSFNGNIENLPVSITHIRFGWNFNTKIKNLPPGLIEIKFGNDFNQRLYNIEGNAIFPKTLRLIHFGYNFNQEIGNNKMKFIPDGVEEIIFGHLFDKSIGIKNLSLLPNNLLKCRLGGNFNREINYRNISYIPNSVEYLVFGYHFNQMIEIKFSENLKYLFFGNTFNQPLKDMNGTSFLPNSLLTLKLNVGFKQDIDVPPNVQNLKIMGYAGKIKGIDDVKYLDLFGLSNKKLDFRESKVSRLSLPGDLDIPIDFLPSTLTFIRFGDRFNQRIGTLFKECIKLEVIEFGFNFNQDVDGNLPESLLILEFGERFNKEVKNLPGKIRRIRFGQNFDRSIDFLPDSIDELYLVMNEYQWKINRFPENLKKLRIPSKNRCMVNYPVDCIVDVRI